MNSTKQKLLVLGSDFFAYQVVVEAKKMGVYTIVSDLMQNSPAKNTADEQWFISTTDIDSLAQKCLEQGVNGVICGASDFNVEQSRKLCKRLNLPLYCESDYAWNVSRNKYLFKEECKRAEAPVAQDYYISEDTLDEDVLKVHYPVVVKPVDLSGNRGVSFCDTADELILAIKTAHDLSDNDTIIIEQRLQGTEHHVCYAAENGKFKITSFAEAYHDSKQASNIYSLERNSALYLKQYLSEVNEKLIHVFENIGCTNGIVWVDTMRNEADGKFYILEMGYRFAGALASCAFNERVTGFNPVRWMIESALGINHSIESVKAPDEWDYRKCLALFHMFANHSGKIGKIEGVRECLNENVFVDFPKLYGGEARAFATVGLFNLYAEGCDELCDLLKSINENVKVFDENDKSLGVYFTDYEKLLSDYKAGMKDLYNE